MKATAIANSNIALVKYWGKRDEKLVLPFNNNVSMTLDKLNTKTTVDFDEKYDNDKVVFWKDWDKKIERETSSDEIEKIISMLNIVREMSGKKLCAKVETFNNFPTAAGLASSASGFAALAMAASKAIGLDLNKKELSILARKSGSGSASRSIEGGFVEFYKGKLETGEDSFAEQIFPEEHWKELRMIVGIVSSGKKEIGSTEGMNLTVESSPYYEGWLETVEKDVETMKKAIKEKDLTLLGKTAEQNALKMHAAMLTTTPSIMYWKAGTIELMELVKEIRNNGTEAYFTIDAGPNVKILCFDKDVEYIKTMAEEIKDVQKTVVCKIGSSAKYVDDHLF